MHARGRERVRECSEELSVPDRDARNARFDRKPVDDAERAEGAAERACASQCCPITARDRRDDARMVSLNRRDVLAGDHARRSRGSSVSLGVHVVSERDQRAGERGTPQALRDGRAGRITDASDHASVRAWVDGKVSVRERDRVTYCTATGGQDEHERRHRAIPRELIGERYDVEAACEGRSREPAVWHHHDER